MGVSIKRSAWIDFRSIRKYLSMAGRYYEARLRIHSEVIPSERLTGIYTGQPGRVERAGSRGRWESREREEERSRALRMTPSPILPNLRPSPSPVFPSLRASRARSEVSWDGNVGLRCLGCRSTSMDRSMSTGLADYSRNDRAASYSSCLGSPRLSSHRLLLAATAPTANVATALKMTPSRFRTPSPEELFQGNDCEFVENMLEIWSMSVVGKSGL